MSDRMMTVAEAQMWVAQDKSTRPTPRAARTIVAQAAQITRLQNALNEIEDWGFDVIEAITGVGILLPGDMEAPEVSDE